MLVYLYVEALLVDEALADEAWEYWNAGLITDDVAALVLILIALSCPDRFGEPDTIRP